MVGMKFNSKFALEPLCERNPQFNVRQRERTGEKA